ncbi:pyridoxamine 5'-phosphate oxidase family protein [Paenibacillus sp. WLX1005]|uniref:pyridoxamine 5'-phosphate oxidase family protein n=1 Tax=Paenibacillus sp. WLX1005 TaxID=3243766 RepID=UPI0039841138
MPKEEEHINTNATEHVLQSTEHQRETANSNVKDSQQIALPPALLQLLNGQRLEDHQHLAMLLLTVGENGFPYQAMVSVGEVLAVDEQHVRIALWTGTNTTGNLQRDGKALLSFVYADAGWTLRLRMKELPELADSMYPRARFEGTIEHIKQDIAQYADLLTGITFRLHEPEQGLERWKVTLDELKR